MELILQETGDEGLAIEQLLNMSEIEKKVPEPEPIKTSLSAISAELVRHKSPATKSSKGKEDATSKSHCSGVLTDLECSNKVFVILRGLPGSGKTSLAKK